MTKIEDKKALLEWFELNNMVKFTLYRGHNNEAKNRIFCQDDSDWSLEQAKAKLDTLLGWYGDKGDFYLFVTDSKNGTGGGFSTPVTLHGSGSYNNNGQNNINGIMGVPAGYVSMTEVQNMIGLATLEMENKSLRDQIGSLQTGGAGRQLTAWENMMEQVLQDEGSGKEIATGIRDVLRGLGMATNKIAGNMFERSEGNQAPSERAPAQQKQTKKQQHTEGGANLEKKDMDGRKFMVLFPKVKQEFPEASPQNVFAAVWEMYESADPMKKEFLKDSLIPLIEKHEGIPSPSPDQSQQTTEQ